MNTSNHLVIIGLIALTTMLTRFLPFVMFPSGNNAPQWIKKLGQILPGAIFSMLVVYCLRSVNLITGSHGLPEGIAIAVVVILHLWKRQMLLSIAGGTFCYMLLIQFVF